MKKLLFSLAFLSLSLKVFSSGDSLRFHIEPFTSFVISGAEYKGFAIEPGATLKFKRSSIGVGFPLLMNTQTELGHDVGAGLNGWNVFYNFSPLSSSKKINYSVTYDLLYNEYNDRHIFKTPVPADPYYIDEGYKETKSYVENYIDVNCEYRIYNKLKVYGAIGVGCSYSKYSKTGSRYDIHRTEFGPAGILKIGVHYSL